MNPECLVGLGYRTARIFVFFLFVYLSVYLSVCNVTHLHNRRCHELGGSIDRLPEKSKHGHLTRN